MNRVYEGILGRISNFQLAIIAGQGKDYILRNFNKANRWNDELVLAIDYDNLLLSADKIMKLYGANTWKKLYLIETDLIRKGEYLKAYFVRILSQKCAVKYYDNGKIISNKFLLAWSMFYEGREKMAKSIINRELRYPFLKLTKSKIYVLYDILSGNLKDDYLQEKLIQYDLGLHDKNIIIVGPLVTEDQEAQLEEMNSGDVIIKINNIKKDKGAVPDVSFYNGEIMKAIASGMRTLPELSCYVFHKFVYKFQSPLVKDNKAKLIYFCNYLFGLGQANMLPNVLFHLLAMKPSKVKVNGFNLYMSKTVYNNSYLNGDAKDRDISVLKNSFVHHNIISQYQFISTLYKKGFFIADETLKEILDNGIEYYLKNLESLIN